MEETIACAGTPIEQASFKAGKKSFLFVQQKDGGVVLRLKLQESLPAAEKDPVAEVGVGGWVTLRLDGGTSAPKGVTAWIKESHALSSGGATKKAARKTTRKKA